MHGILQGNISSFYIFSIIKEFVSFSKIFRSFKRCHLSRKFIISYPGSQMLAVKFFNKILTELRNTDIAVPNLLIFGNIENSFSKDVQSWFIGVDAFTQLEQYRDYIILSRFALFKISWRG